MTSFLILFSNASEYLSQKPVQASFREHLKRLLKKHGSRRIIFITLQKFEEYDDIILINKNIFLDIITTLMLAAENGKLRVVTYFIENGIDINAKYGYDYYKKIGEAADYLGLGYSIFGKYKGMTILIIASKKGHVEIVKQDKRNIKQRVAK